MNWNCYPNKLMKKYLGILKKQEILKLKES